MDERFDVGGFLDTRKIGAFQVVVVMLCSLAMMIDGYNLYALGYVLVPLATTFRVSPATLTPVLVSQFIGVAVGVYALSPLADRVGRRATLLISAGSFSVATLLLVFTTTLFQFGLLRFITGVFFGGILPNAIALAAETVPNRLRVTTIGILYVGFSVGPVTAALVADSFLHRFGWQAPFILGGVIPLLLLPIFHRWLPESLRFLVNRNPRDPQIRIVLQKFKPAVRISPNALFFIAGEQHGKLAIGDLFRDGRAIKTSLLWVSSFFLGLNLALLGTWFPTILRTVAGLPVERAIMLAGFYAFGFIPGALIISVAADAFRAPAATLTLAIGGSATALFLLPHCDAGTWKIYVDLLMTGCCNGGATSILGALAASLYPTTIRSMGIGWALGTGRIANVIGPAIGGFMLGTHWTLSSISYAVCTIALLAGAGAGSLWLTRAR